MKVLIAPNAFKNCLDADEVAEAIATGLSSGKLRSENILFPVADGGDGTLKMLRRYLPVELIQTASIDAIGRPVISEFGWIASTQQAIIEMSSASGIRRLEKEELKPLITTTTGTGLLIKAALSKGARQIIIGVGGSATIDGGAGIIHALGGKFLDQIGNELLPQPAYFKDIARIDMSSFDERMSSCLVTVMCDVTTPLLGTNNAIRMFGPQKGAGEKEILKLEECLQHYCEIVSNQFGKDIAFVKYGGAAGGTSAGIMAMLNGTLVNGIDYFLEYTRFDEELAKADVVITGEGNLDEQTLTGKAPYGVAQHAKQYNKPVIAIAGQVDRSFMRNQNALFDAVFSINTRQAPLPDLIKGARENIIHTAAQIGNLLSI
jgi:glycerate 2-kinase